jgi:hypothetical protein
MSIEKSNDLIGNQNRNLPVCIMGHQRTALPRMQNYIFVSEQKDWHWDSRRGIINQVHALDFYLEGNVHPVFTP